MIAVGPSCTMWRAYRQWVRCTTDERAAAALREDGRLVLQDERRWRQCQRQHEAEHGVTDAEFSVLGCSVEGWLRQGCVQCCRCCKGLEFASLNEKNLHVPPEDSIAMCSFCVAGNYKRPQPWPMCFFSRNRYNIVITLL